MRVPESTDEEVIQGAIGVLVVVGAILLFFYYVWGPQQLYLAFKYNVAPWNVVVPPYPDNECSFWRVPRGNKHCHHEEIIRTLDRQGSPVEPDSPNIDRVIVTWGGIIWDNRTGVGDAR